MKKAYQGQGLHLLAIVVLLAAMSYVLKFENMLTGDLWGLTTKTWVAIALATPILHQVYVVVIWRLELYKQAISSRYGEKGFIVYGFFFLLFLAARPISIILLAFSNQETFDLSWTWRWILTLVLAPPFLYLGFSIKKYFGIPRALGEDHFKPEEYRNGKMIKEGIFKYTNNGMYLYGFLGLYLPAILLASKAALAVAIFQHLYIWVHYFVTEKPDMEEIYG